MEQPTPFPWWLWILAGLWTGGIVLRLVRPMGRDTSRVLDVLITVYTGLLAYMAASATTGGLPAVGWIRAGWWIGAALALGGTTVCLLGSSARIRNIGWVIGVLGIVSLVAWLQAPELAVIGVVVGIVGWLRPLPMDQAMYQENHRGDLRPPARPDGWLVTVMATLVCVAWLGAVEFADRVELSRAGVSPRFTALPAAKPVKDAASSLDSSVLLLAGAVIIIAFFEARPHRTAAEDRPA